MQNMMPKLSAAVNQSGTSGGAGKSAKLVLLGTAGGPSPKLNRSAPAQAIVVDESVYLIDAGNGVAQQMHRAGLSVDKLRTIAITHHHSDHVADVGTVLVLAWGTNLSTTVDIIGPAPLRSMMDSFFDFSRVDIDIRTRDEGRPHLKHLVNTIELEPGKDPLVVFEDHNVRITAAQVNHPPIDCFAYRIDTENRSFVISGDTTPCTALVELAKGADVLVHEAMHLPSIAALTADFDAPNDLLRHLRDSHTSTQDVGKVAQAAGVGMLVLSHLVPSDAQIEDAAWVEQARIDFDGDVILGHDLMWV